MLPFLAYPRRYTQSAITRYWLNCLERTASTVSRPTRLAHGLLIDFVILGAAAPFVTPIYSPDRMLVIYIPALALTWYMAIRTLAYAAILVEREADGERWESLVLTGINARQVILGKWWAVVRFFARDYFKAACLRLFTAYGLAVYFHITSTDSCPTLNAFCYGTSGWSVVHPPPGVILHHPAFLLALFGLVLLVGFALLELALSSAVGIFAGLALKRRRSGVLLSMSLRAVLLAISLESLDLISDTIARVYETMWESSGCFTCVPGLREIALAPYRLIDVLETVQASISTFFDGGALLAANFLRGSPGENNTFDFLARNVFAAGLGMLLFVALIWLLLRVSMRLAIRQGAMPPQD